MKANGADNVAQSYAQGLDWSSLLSYLHEDLAKAEHSLRLLHMGERHRDEARVQLDNAMISLKLLKGWCDG